MNNATQSNIGKAIAATLRANADRQAREFLGDSVERIRDYADAIPMDAAVVIYRTFEELSLSAKSAERERGLAKRAGSLRLSHEQDGRAKGLRVARIAMHAQCAAMWGTKYTYIPDVCPAEIAVLAHLDGFTKGLCWLASVGVAP